MRIGRGGMMTKKKTSCGWNGREENDVMILVRGKGKGKQKAINKRWIRNLVYNSGFGFHSKFYSVNQFQFQ